MFQKANSSGDFSGNCFDLLFPVKRAVNLYTKVLGILDFFKTSSRFWTSYLLMVDNIYPKSTLIETCVL